MPNILGRNIANHILAVIDHRDASEAFVVHERQGVRQRSVRANAGSAQSPLHLVWDNQANHLTEMIC